MSERAAKTGLGLALLAILTDILAIALPWWSYREDEFFGDELRLNHGLWEECSRKTDIFGVTSNSCLQIQTPSGHVRLARNTCLFGLILIIGAMLATFVGRWVKVDLKLVPLVGALLMMLAGFLIWLGILVFSASYVQIAGNEPWDVHAGWYLGFATTVLCFISTFLLLWDKVRAGNIDQSESEAGPSAALESPIHRKPSFDFDKTEVWSPKFLEGYNNKVTPMYPPVVDRSVQATPNNTMIPYPTKKKAY